MKVNDLMVTSGEGGTTAVKVWVHCYTIDDVDDLIHWLQRSKTMLGWQPKRKQRKIGGKGGGSLPAVRPVGAACA